MKRGLNILITNFVLDTGTGSEMYVFDLALELEQEGHFPVVFTPRSGVLAQRMLAQGICVVTHIDQIPFSPDVIQGHHTIETLAAAVRFPNTPVVFVCHDSYAWHDQAPTLPNIRRYVAVDQACHDRLIYGCGVEPRVVDLVSNGVNLARFPLRPELPQEFRSIGLFGNSFTATHLEILRQAFPGIEVTCIGSGNCNQVVEPGSLVLSCDLILARGRCARESIATGAATIVADATGMGGLVTSRDYVFQETNNFGRRLIRLPFDVEHLQRTAMGYNASDTRQIALKHRELHSLSRKAEALVAIYHQVINEMAGAKFKADEWSRETAKWLTWCSLHANVSPPTFHTITPISMRSAEFPSSVPAKKKRSIPIRVVREMNRFVRRIRKAA